jgi:hypothetical protein
MDGHKIEWKPGVPTDPEALAKWLQDWHRQHNTIEPGDKRPNYKLTDQGRKLMGLSVGGETK